MANKRQYIALPMNDLDEDNYARNIEMEENQPKTVNSKFKFRPVTIKVNNLTTMDPFTPLTTQSQSSRGSMAYKTLWQRTENKQARLNTQLMNSVQNGELESVKKFLLMGANPNTICRSNNVSVLNLAGMLGLKEIMCELLDFGACIDFEDNHGQNILHYLAFAENTECLREIINHSKLNSRRINILSTIINRTAVNKKQQFILTKFFSDNLEHNCDEINHFIPIFDRGSTALHVACQQANIEICRILVANGASLEIEDQRACLPMNVIGEAFINTNEDELEIELQSFYETIEYFIQIKANFNDNATNLCISEIIPLQTALELNHLDAIKLLLGYGANPGALNKHGETIIHLSIKKKNEDILKVLTDKWVQTNENINFKNLAGYTPFQTAVDLQWIPGIYILLDAGADVTEVAHNCDSALHIAASSGNIDLLQELLDIKETMQMVEARNINEETPLFCAVKSGSLPCVRALLTAGANIFTEQSNNCTLLHRTAEYGYCDILYELVTLATETDKKEWLDKRDNSPMSGRTALHIAAMQNQYYCVKTLLDAGCNIRIKTLPKPYDCFTALHFASQYGHFRIVELLLEYNKEIINDENGCNWKALHIAASNGQRRCVQMLLKHGANLSEWAICCDNLTNKCLTAVDMIMQNISRPTEFLEDTLNSCITKNEYSVNDPNCVISVNHTILMPSENRADVMKVLKAIMNTGNRFDQKRLLLHPVVESYLHTKWRALSPFYYLIFALYILNGMALTIIALIQYFFGYDDIYLSYLFTISLYTVLFTLMGIIFQEILHAKQNVQKYLTTLETWLKWIIFIMSIIIVCNEIFCTGTNFFLSDEWFRHLTSITILFTWIELMFLFSRFPVWGYYVLMFFKVTKTVLKVLLTFGFLIIGFSLSFFIEFKTKPPFSNPLEALAKTIVMMTSEYDYMDLFSQDDGDDDWTMTLIIGRFVFMAFLVLVSIVLMNLMVGLAVDDINGLEIKGQIQRLEKQVEFLSALSFLGRLKRIKSKLSSQPEWIPMNERFFVFYPEKPAQNAFGTNIIPLAIIDRLTDIASQTEQENEITLAQLDDKIDTIQNNIEKKLNQLLEHKETVKKSIAIQKPKKKLLQHLQNILKRNEVSKSAAQSVEDLNERALSPQLAFTDSQRLDNIERNLKQLEDVIKQLFINKADT